MIGYFRTFLLGRGEEGKPRQVTAAEYKKREHQSLRGLVERGLFLV